MGEAFGLAGFRGDLKVHRFRRPSVNGARVVRTPLGRMILTKDRGDSHLLSGEQFITNLHAVHRGGDGGLIDEYDLGSGLVTNVGTLAMSNDFAWSSSLNLATLALSNQHFTGTGTTAAAVTDIKLQTVSTQGGQNAVAGIQSLVVPTNLGTAAQGYKTIATVNYTGTEAVTEWGLMTSATLTATTGSPFTNVTATSATVTGTPLTASAAGTRGQQQTVVEAGTTASWGLITSNTTSVLTIPKWYATATGNAGTQPGNTETYTLRPVMWDHKVFSAINVNNGDSIQFTYTLTVASGG